MAEQTSTQSNELSCEQCRELLSDYVDRELSEAEKTSVERHLGSCVKCGSESSRIQGLKKIVQHWDGVKGSGEFRKSLMDKMIRESQQMQAATVPEAKNEQKGALIAQAEDDTEVRSLPPIWILLVATVLAVVAYFIVLKLRGIH